jgi:hypothetical protein
MLVGGAAFLFLVVSPVVSLIRQDAGFERLSVSSLAVTYGSVDNPVVSTVADLGSSMYTITGTLQEVPKVRPYDGGLGYVHAILNVVPNFVTPLKFALPYGTPDNWFVKTVDPTYARAQGGLGYSFIAEAYLEFGFFGAPFVLFLIATLLSRLFEWGVGGAEPARVAAVASYLTFILHFPRGVAEGYTRQLFVYALLPYGLAFVIAKFRRKVFTSIGAPAAWDSQRGLTQASTGRKSA